MEKKCMKDSYDTSDLDSDNYSIKSTSSTLSVDGKIESADDFINKKLAVNDLLLVKYTRKKTIKQFVGQILNIFEDGLSINLVFLDSDKVFFPNFKRGVWSEKGSFTLFVVGGFVLFLLTWRPVPKENIKKIEGSLRGGYWNFVCRRAQRGFRLRKEKREAEIGRKRAALAPGRIRNFAADYLLGRAGDAGFGRKRSCRSTHLLNDILLTQGVSPRRAFRLRYSADTRGVPKTCVSATIFCVSADPLHRNP
ncbi:hypothetical protein AVEN_229271-1 [Araneus ventricosus]|uniref:Uncharacterized protein n=1 Tax=Araneus ventricosus TaxID=182803 RepID=A0A4Y2QHY0_ARAVE|nr:hypothetical protein AVEN_229271-1 [Araneus ventricosus]